MITDLFEYCTCKACGNTQGFRRLETLSSEYGTDFICICRECGNLFIKPYERQVQNG
jgi:uncharacterized Zn finger protein